MRKAIALGVAAVILVIAAVVIRCEVATTNAPAPAPAPGRSASGPASASASASASAPASASGSASGSGAGSTHDPRVKEAVGGIGIANPLQALPDHYELDARGGYAVVNLGGGPATIFPFSDRPAEPTRASSGRVVDGSGAPIAGAVILCDTNLWIQGGATMARAGATSAADGTFSLDNAPTGDAIALAISPAGWSDVVPVTGDPLTLVIRGRAALAGTVTYNGHGESAELILRPNPAVAFHINDETASDGTYTIAALPPGTYKVSVGLAQAPVSGAVSHFVDSTVTVVPGQTARLDVALKSASIVELTATVPDAPANVIDYALLATPAPISVADFHARVKSDAQKRQMLVGGRDATLPVELQDVAAGAYVACAIADTNRAFGCIGVEVHDGDPPHDVAIPLAKL